MQSRNRGARAVTVTWSPPARLLTLALAGLILATAVLLYNPPLAAGESGPAGMAAGPTRRVNATYTTATTNLPVPDRAIFWFGEVGPTTSNFADVRTIYNDEKLVVTVHVYDRQLWYDVNQDQMPPATLTNWDAVTLYLSLNSPSALGDKQYQFVSQLSSVWRDRDDFQTAYKSSGGVWAASNTAFTTDVGWQGAGLNDPAVISSGWYTIFHIPYSSLGLASKPAANTAWRLGLVVHDRDDSQNSPIAAQIWPETVNHVTPSSWGELSFGLPSHNPPLAAQEGSLAITHGVNGASVPDVHVGGGTTCATDIWPQFWQQWGFVNRGGTAGFNVQNQWNLGDWPCFSKYYVTFPTDSIPPGKIVISAFLRMHMFGGSNSDRQFPGEPQPSWIQALTIEEDWNEFSITWNNAPMAVENVAGTWVEPRPVNAPPNTHFPYDWDVSYALAKAYAAGEPLRLVFYSADNNQHSGKYFRTAEHYNPAERPTLTITYGVPMADPEQAYMPHITNR